MNMFANHFLTGVCLCCAAAAVLGVSALKSERKDATRVLLAAKVVVIVAAAFSIVVVNLFIKAFIGDDFSIAAVAQYSSSDMPFITLRKPVAQGRALWQTET